MMKQMVMVRPLTIMENVLILMLVASALSGMAVAEPLRYDFYKSSCPKAEQVVRRITGEIIFNDTSMGAAFLMMFFFDCFQQGCDASLLLDEQKETDSVTEKSWMATYLPTYDAMNEIKTAMEAICPGVVSCVDIIALAARDATTISGSFSFPMPTGRRDALVSITYYDYTHIIPVPYMEVQELIKSFAARGLDIDDLVVLSGAHSFGISYCRAVKDRLYPTMNDTYAAMVKEACSTDHEWNKLNNNLVTNPDVLSNQYYSNILSG
ncbi:hypothetical protein PR202_ga11166 [Eleusine coracana subsp. coracana]|uniref:Plant heme peroxidase family profile domain-containing protein n=1 Tax=Eleusine coracana subsp. coracana TaxID=191504 RepID=A0AAV5C8W6_ELECO|nr:hypothetical protein PR202_ga11166 [Eleusine coracana subsp. coracana]